MPLTCRPDATCPCTGKLPAKYSRRIRLYPAAVCISLRALNSTGGCFSGILFSIYNKGGITLIWILTAVTIRVTI